MAQFEQHFVQDLTQQIKVRHCGSIVFNADNESNVVSVRLFNGSEPVAISGSVVGAVVCSDGSTVPLTGSYSGNTASITLTGDCFAVLGQIGVGIQIVNGTQKTTVLKAIYNVETLTTENEVDPGSRITLEVGDLISDIETATAAIPASDMASLMSGIAPTFSDSVTYKAGAYVYYGGDLYCFTADHNGGTWTGSDVTAAVLCNDVSDLKSAVSYISTTGNIFDAANVVEGYWVSGSAGNTLSYVADSNACYFSVPVIGKNGSLSISVVNFPSWANGDNVGRIAKASDLKIYTPVYGHKTPIDTITFTGSWTETNTDMVLYINSTIADKDKMAVYINEVITQYTPYDGVALSIKNSPLYEKKLCCNGDSIMYGAGATGGFASIIAAKYGMTLQNIAVSGGTIASGTTDGGTNRHWIAATMSNLANDGDYYIIEGGLNDYSLNVPLFTDGQTDVRNNISTTQPSDLTAFSEAMESICYDLVVNHTEKKKGFVFPHKISWLDWTSNSLSKTYLYYKDVQKKILQKWGIPFLDLSEVSGMDTVFNAIAIAYTSNNDRTHPNANGYLKFYVPHIERFMESL